MGISPRILLGVTTLTLAGAVGLGASAAHAHKVVSLDVEGETREVSTYAASVSDLLAEEGVEPGPKDLVAPAGDTPLDKHSAVIVRWAKELTLLDGSDEKTIVTTALTASEAVDAAAGRDDAGAILVTRASERSAPALALHLTVGEPVTITADGESDTKSAGVDDVDALLDEEGITLKQDDHVTLREGDDGNVELVVTRIRSHNKTTEKEIPFETVRENDDTIYVGTEEKAQEGQVGTLTTVKRVTTRDGKVIKTKKVSETVTVEPVNEIIKVGTKPKPKPKPKPAVASSGGGTVRVGRDASGLNWGALAACESGGNPSAVNPSGKYFGLYQFSVATWQSVGGSGLPSEASADEQTARAQALYSRSGAGQWPVCGSRLFG